MIGNSANFLPTPAINFRFTIEIVTIPAYFSEFGINIHVVNTTTFADLGKRVLRKRMRKDGKP